MKGSPKILALLLIAMVVVFIISGLFAYADADFYSAYGASVSSQPAIAPYYELLYIVVGIIGITAVFLLLIKYRLGKAIAAVSTVIYFIILLLVSTITIGVISFYLFNISIIIQSTAADLLTLLAYALPILALIYYFRYAGAGGRNIVNIVVFGVVAEVIASLLGIVPSLILVAIIAVYDYISVFITKHMITLANGMAGSPIFSGIELMSKKAKRRFVLGGGDLVFPAIVFNAFLLNGRVIEAVVAGAGALIGLAIIVIFGKKNKAYPAMAVIAPIQLIFIGIFSLLVLV